MVLDVTTDIKVLRVANKMTLDIMIDLLGDLNICQHHKYTLRYLDDSMELWQGEWRTAKMAAFRAQIESQSK